jgi:hypothetical protein
MKRLPACNADPKQPSQSLPSKVVGSVRAHFRAVILQVLMVPAFVVLDLRRNVELPAWPEMNKAF